MTVCEVNFSTPLRSPLSRRSRFLRDGLDFGVGQRALLGLEPDRDGERFLPLRERPCLRRDRKPPPARSIGGPPRARPSPPDPPCMPASRTKAKSRSTAIRSDASSLARALVARGLGSGNGIEENFESRDRPFQIEGGEDARMQLAEISERLWPKRNRSGPSRMIPGRGARLHRRGHHLPPGGFEGGQRIGLGAEHIGTRAALGPMTGEVRRRGCRRQSPSAPRACRIRTARRSRTASPARSRAPDCAEPAASREGRREGRIASRSAEIGFSNCAPRRRRRTKPAWARGMKEKCTVSSKPRAARARRAEEARRWAGCKHGARHRIGPRHRDGRNLSRDRGCGRFLPPDRQRHARPSARTAA